MYTDFACMCAMSLLAKQPRFSNTVHIIFKRGFSLMMRGHLLHLLQNCFASFYAKIMSNCKEQSSKKICSKAKFTSFEYTVSATFSAIFWFVDFFWQMANFTDCLDLDFLCTIKRSVELLYVTLLCIQQRIRLATKSGMLSSNRRSLVAIFYRQQLSSAVQLPK